MAKKRRVINSGEAMSEEQKRQLELIHKLASPKPYDPVAARKSAEWMLAGWRKLKADNKKQIHSGGSPGL